MTANKRGWPHPRRLYASELPVEEQLIELADESRKHAQVLRLRAGDDVELFDAAGCVALATVAAMDAKRASCRAQPLQCVPRERPSLHMVLGMPKGDKLDNAVRMLTELGAASIHIAQTERAVPRPTDMQARLARLTRIAREACAQSGQAYAPEVHAPADLATIGQRAPANATKWLLWEESAAPRPYNAASIPDDMWVVVGPEGGLTPLEAEGLRAQTFVELSIGPAILRFETAVITAATLALDYMGRLR
jgi:16S rRNA (uracil1498-N3)-methyltransferase